MQYKGRTIYYDKKGYPIIWVAGKNVKLHIFVWEEANGEKPKGYQIHHKDDNKENWELDNLQLVTQSEHFRIHAGWIKTNGEWTHKPCNGCKKILPLSDFYPRKNLPPTALCKPCHNKKIAERSLDPKIQEKIRGYKRKWARKNR